MAETGEPVRKVVLIADDESSLRLLVSATLETDDVEVLEASNGEEALSLARAHRPDLAILDWQMPRRTGVDVCAAIKGDPDLARTKVILLTSRARPVDTQEGLAAGADAYLTKPFSPLDLLERVEHALGVNPR